MGDADYNQELHREQEKIRLQREKVYSRAAGATFVLDEEESEWVQAALYKLLRFKNHTRSKAKGMDDLIDAANYVGLIFHKLWMEGNRPATSEELIAASGIDDSPPATAKPPTWCDPK